MVFWWVQCELCFRTANTKTMLHCGALSVQMYIRNIGMVCHYNARLQIKKKMLLCLLCKIHFCQRNVFLLLSYCPWVGNVSIHCGCLFLYQACFFCCLFRQTRAHTHTKNHANLLLLLFAEAILNVV